VTETILTTTKAPAARPDPKPVVALLAANAISLTGNTLTALAIPWFVLITTGSAARTGVVAFAQMAPIVLASFFGGALVDRVVNKRLSIVTVQTGPSLYGKWTPVFGVGPRKSGTWRSRDCSKIAPL
jgi:MFS family permease